ncbi:phage/plasmid primase, P4 family [Lactobacillus sp. ESL0228]|uniref:DNA primase family protein n=1 Tax=Lactobacillus sp. ESL0228 TaxID=2069352 RepID=UPI000EFB2168|nr:phage/plasmid primase, P4 family [Lactobacillus sp. ESL0228]RMC49755.1 hypothetical protein F5ESL0228_03285 [Lactobacillus sp. ESL0228]
MTEEKLNTTELNKIKERQNCPSVSWIYREEESGKRKVDIPKLGKTILAEHNCLIVENSDKEDFYEYNEKLHYWEQRNIKSLKSVVTSLLNKQGMWRDKTARDAFHFISDSIKRVKWADTFGKIQGNYFNFKNGVWDWDAMQLIPHDPKYYFTFCTDYDLIVYDIAKAEQEAKNADHKKNRPLETEKWLALSLGENITPMMEFIGYTFYPSYKPIQAFILIIGNGGDGKTTFARYLTNLLVQSNVAHVPMENLTDDKSNNFSLSELFGKWLNIHDDISKSFIRNPAIIKTLTGGGEMNASVKNRSDITFSNHAKLLFIGNEEPSFSDTTNGFKRRAYVINFNHIDNFDKNISMAKVKQERGKFVYTCLYYAKKAMNKHELTQTTSIIQTRKKWLTDNDLVQQFLNENYIQVDDSKINQNELYRDYREWCDNNGTKPLSNIKLKNELERKGITTLTKRPWNSNGKRPRVTYYVNLSPK